MNIIELINHCGGVNSVMAQTIQGSAVKVTNKKSTKDCEVTIATNQINANDYMNNSGKFGLVLWLDGEKAREVLK